MRFLLASNICTSSNWFVWVLLFFLITKTTKTLPLHWCLQLYACIRKAPWSQALLCHYSSRLKPKPRSAFSIYGDKHFTSWRHCLKVAQGENVLRLLPLSCPTPDSDDGGYSKPVFNSWRNQVFTRCISLHYYFLLVLRGICCKKKNLLFQIWNALCIRLCLALTYVFAAGNWEWHYTYHN